LHSVKTIGIVGAGMMGKGIAYCAAYASIQVVIKDTSDNTYGFLKNYFQKIGEKQNLSELQIKTLLSRVRLISDYPSFVNCDIVIEAVFEDREVKNRVFESLSKIPFQGIVASNTSTLPISSLASKYSRPQNFVGLHFFSPVPQMPLVEIIKGKQTSELSLFKAQNFVKQLKKTPIVVNDGRGFYTTRVFQAYVYEGMAALSEGVNPTLIEAAGKSAGMPVGPLALADEVSLDLLYHLNTQLEKDTGQMQEVPGLGVLKKMVEDWARLGRKTQAGFYTYTQGGKSLWSELNRHWPVSQDQPTQKQLESRFLNIQSLESLRAKKEGVLLNEEDANTGSILGLGFPQEKGGALGYIKHLGQALFLDECRQLAKVCGTRFDPEGLLP